MLAVVSLPTLAGTTMTFSSGLGAANSVGRKDSKDTIYCNMQLFREAHPSSLAIGLLQINANRAWNGLFLRHFWFVSGAILVCFLIVSGCFWFVPALSDSSCNESVHWGWPKLVNFFLHYLRGLHVGFSIIEVKSQSLHGWAQCSPALPVAVTTNIAHVPLHRIHTSHIAHKYGTYCTYHTDLCSVHALHIAQIHRVTQTTLHSVHALHIAQVRHVTHDVLPSKCTGTVGHGCNFGIAHHWETLKPQWQSQILDGTAPKPSGSWQKKKCMARTTLLWATIASSIAVCLLCAMDLMAYTLHAMISAH